MKNGSSGNHTGTFIVSLTGLLKANSATEAAYLGAFYLFVIAVSVVAGIPLIFDSDAYYYFNIARNIANGAGSTFDGVTVTTGYHPLWLGVSTAVHYIFKDVASFHYAIHGLLTVLFIAGHFLLLRVAVVLGISIRSFIILSLPLLVLNLAGFQSGLENTLLFFLFSLFLWLQYQTWRNGRLTVAAISLVLLLVYFTRLDSIFLVALYLPWYFVKNLACR